MNWLPEATRKWLCWLAESMDGKELAIPRRPRPTRRAGVTTATALEANFIVARARPPQMKEIAVKMEHRGAGRRIRRSTGALVSLAPCVILLAATWYFLFIVIAAMTESLLAPWDLVYVGDRPPLGDWNRAVSDYFEGSPGSLLPSVIVVASSAALFVSRARRVAQRDRLAAVFAAMNLLSLPLSLVLMNLGYGLSYLVFPQPQVPFDVGFHRTAFPAAAVALAFAALLVAQSRFMKPSLGTPD